MNSEVENRKVGRGEVILGGMFTGKTTELMRRLLVEAVVEKGRVIYVNHSFDTRTDGDFSSHNILFHDSLPEGSGIRTFKMSDLRRLLTLDFLDDVKCIGIDEGQFFPELAEVVRELIELHAKHVIVASLSSNYERGQTYGPIQSTVLDLIPFCDKVSLLKGKCALCAREGRNTTSLFTHKEHHVESLEGVPNTPGTLDVGASEKYVSVCRACYVANQTTSET